MPHETLLDDLVSLYQELCRQGRAATAEEVCAGHAELLDDFKSRLEGLASMEAFLGAAGGDTPGCAEGRASTRADGAGADDADDAPLPEVAGYRIERKLGEGGMGVVYLAWQLSPRRCVALKMIQGGHARPEERTRLLREAQAQADLEHPHVVRVYEVGEHQGRPFLSLELVGGGSLSRKIRNTPQPPRQAAVWMEPLARALHTAHTRGIIHRDLKPGNILLTTEGTPKLTDFGLAKLVEVSAAEVHAAGLTPSGAIVGTPSYMAPEQAAGRTREVGPAADVYALGAVLYECLTGRPPFLGETLLDTLQQVRTQEPVPVRHLQPRVPRDLETICLKCLEKEPRRRYASAAQLAERLALFLDGKPIPDRPIGPTERLWRWCRRNRAVAALLATVAVVLIAGAAVSTVLAVVANEQAGLARRKAADEEEARKKAEWARDRTFQALDAMTSTVTGESLGTQASISAEQKRFLAEVLTYYQEFAGEQGENEGTRQRAASAAHRVGLIQARLGDRKASARAFELARDSYGSLVADYPSEPAYRQGVARSHINLGIVLMELGKRAEAEGAYRGGLNLYEQLAAGSSTGPEYRQELATCHFNLGLLLRRSGNLPEAEAAHRKALALRGDLRAEFPTVAHYSQDLADSHNSLGNLLLALGRQGEAEAAFQQALALKQELVANFPAVPRYRLDLGVSHNNLGMLMVAQGQWAKAETAYRQAQEIYARLVAEFPAEPKYRQALAGSYSNLGGLSTAQGKQAEGEPVLRQGLLLLEKLAAEFPAVPQYRQELGKSHHNLGIVLTDLRRPTEAEAALRQAVGLLNSLATEFPALPAYRIDLARSQYNLGDVLLEGGRATEALGCYGHAITLLEPLVEAEPRLAVERQLLRYAHAARAGTLHGLDRPADAIRDWDRAINLAPAPEKGGVRANRARALARAGQLERALAEAADLAKAPEADETQLYHLACVYAVAANKDEASRARYTQAALQLLRRAVARGCKDVDRLKQDDDLRLLRDHDAFRKLLAELERK